MSESQKRSLNGHVNAVMAPTPGWFSSKTATIALIAGASSLLSIHAHAISLANDNFTLSNGTNASSISNTEASGVGTYVLTQNSDALSVVNPSFFGSSNALQTNQGTFVSYRAFNEDSTLTLNSLNTGESIILNFDVGFNANPNNSLSFGFVNQAGDINSIAYASISLLDTNTSKGFMYRPGSTAMGSGLGTVIADDRWSESDIAPLVSYNFELEIQKESDGGFTLSYRRDRSPIHSLTVTSSDTWATTMGGVDITGVSFRNESGAAGSDMVIDNLTVVVVPEAGTYALMVTGFCGIVAFWMRRRTRRN